VGRWAGLEGVSMSGLKAKKIRKEILK